MAKILLRVQTSSGENMPIAFTLRDRLFRVKAMLDHWQGSDHAYYKIIADDGNLYVLRHDLEENEWEMVLMEAPLP